MSIPPSRLIVIARDYQQFRAWCYDEQIAPHDRRILALTSTDSLAKLMGTRGLPYLLLGWPRWFRESQYRVDLLPELEARESKPVTADQLTAWKRWIDETRNR